MSKLDKSYMPIEVAVSEIVPFLTQNLTSVEAWHYTNDKAQSLAHALSSGVNQLKAENTRLREALVEVSEMLPGTDNILADHCATIIKEALAKETTDEQ